MHEEALIKTELSNKVLNVGPDYKNHRGGIGAIIATYSTIFTVFKFVPTYQSLSSNFSKSMYFVKQLGVLMKTLSNDKQIEIVHIQGSNSGSFFRKLVVFWISKKIYNKKVIYHTNASSYDKFYNNAGKITKRLVKYLMENVDLLMCVSPWWKDFYGSNFNVKSIVIINNIVDEPQKRVIDNNTDVKVVNFLFLGLLGDRKGIFDLIDVIVANKQAYTGKMKLFIGGNGEVDKLKNVIKQHSLEDIVEYIGWVDSHKKIEYLMKANVYILPSYNEGLPISILEAMSYGLPVISTYVGGTPEVLKNDENGFIFNPGDKKSMAEAITFFLEHKDYIKIYGDKSLIKVKPYLPETVASQLVESYNTLLATK